MTRNDSNPAGKFLVKSSHGYQVLNFDDILYCESLGSYTKINLIDNGHILSSHILKEVESQLPEHLFYRVNRSSLVNVNHIVKYQSSPQRTVILENNKEIKISARKNSRFRTFLLENFPLV